MKKFTLIVVVAALALLVDSQVASAGRCGGGRRGGCGGGHRHSSCGGGHCGYSGGCQSCGYGYGYQGCGSCGMGTHHAAAPYGTSYATCANGTCGIAVASAATNEATLVVNLPEDATLTIDDQPTVSTSTNRVFVTPALENGKTYQYTLKAKVTRNGKVQTTTQQVTVRAGEVSHVELTVPATGVAAQ